ncbi:M23 family metallopeptidase [Belnapia moabensis]|uniref:M23 family metallopeptidase n=1 Tax=Belnapia moabensis TaxID=365533 RepID=UPI000693CC33|nr:M23 family metallopeptidase [Belnapia moabensis]
MRAPLLVAAALLLGAAGEAPELVPPVRPACISSPFGAREGAGPRASRMHGGIDLPAPAGAWVMAAAAGQVAAIRRRGAAGLEVDLVHPGGWVTRYAHLGAVVPALASGKRSVAQGERLGRVGRTGITYGTHLHFELLADGMRQDPAPWLGLARCGAVAEGGR